jgi:protein involved in ribonucleotide reduction
MVSLDIVYFSNYSGNTKRFVEKLTDKAIRIPISNLGTIMVPRPFVLVVPTYGGGSEKSAIPKQVRDFLNIAQNRSLLRGIIGMGNTNFGEHFCKAADMISTKTGVPVIARVEIFGTPEDVEKIKERLEMLNDTTV